MWKWLGAVALWVVLVSLPHLTDAVFGAGFLDDGVAFAGSDEPAARPVAGPYAKIKFQNRLGKTMTITEVRLTLDGRPLPVLTNLAPDAAVELFSGPVFPGAHHVDMQVVCRGNRRGPITYLKDYKWTVTSQEVLLVPEGRSMLFTLAAERVKGINVPLERQIRITARDEAIPGGPPLTN